ncbi:MAG: TetR/AcrR family transcriptional regulator [Propioniciclava sp.]
MATGTGRPRASGESLTGRGTREDILAASAQLFSELGYAATSTHMIARAAGIRQATMYHHFAGKHDILLQLLLGTLRPSVAAAEWLDNRPEPAATRLWALCVSDATLLLGGRHNLGALYLLPELHDARLAQFHEVRTELERRYTSLIDACGCVDAEGWTGLVIGIVESVIIRRRRAPGALTVADAPVIATAALRVLRLSEDAIATAESDGPALLAALPPG